MSKTLTRLEALKDLVQQAIDTGATSVEQIHKTIAALPLAVLEKQGFNIVADFVCPIPLTREIFGADKVIWMDTIKKSRFEDTNEMFVPPTEYYKRITDFNYNVEDL
mgnify:CR=1 FL=1